MVITLSHTGYIKRNPLSAYRSQRRGGKGTTGVRVAANGMVSCAKALVRLATVYQTKSNFFIIYLRRSLSGVL
jgi:DNA gyrase/topoisomerase IV subunit A